MVPDLSLLLPLNNENRWSDLLGTLIAADPEPARALLGIPAGQLRVRREYSASKNDRPDIAIYVDDALDTILEAKVLSGIGPGQLDRYAASSPGAARYVLTHLDVLPVDTHDSPGWSTITWEQLVAAYTASSNPWCAQTAEGWTAHIARSVPPVDADTRWNDLPPGVVFATAIRTRMAWLAASVSPPEGVTAVLATSASGNSAILAFSADTPAPQYRIACAVEEARSVQEWPDVVSGSSTPPKGPYVAMRLEQYGITSSRDFNWRHLAALWPMLRDSGFAWRTRGPSTRAAHDRAGVQTLVDAGVPKYIGRGFGEGQVKHSASCMFGPEFDISPDSTLGEIVRVLDDAALLVRDLATLTAPPA